MPTTTQDKQFANHIEGNFTLEVSTSALDEAIHWIGSELDPEDVFSEKQLSSWAEANGFIKEENQKTY